MFRLGGGISVDPNTFRYLRDDYPATLSSQYSGANSYQAAGSLRTGIPEVIGPDLHQEVFTLPAAVQTTTFPQVFHRGYIESWNATLQRDAPGFNVQVGYAGSRAIRQNVIQNLNAAGPRGGNPGRPLFPQFGRISDIRLSTPFRTNQYNGLLTQVTRRFGGSSLVGVAYTWSRTIGYADDTDGGPTWNWTPMLQRNRAVAGFDRTHNLQLYGNYELPFGRGKNFATAGFASKMAGGLADELDSQPHQRHAVHRGHLGDFRQCSRQYANRRPDPSRSGNPGGHGVGQPYFDPNAFAVVDHYNTALPMALTDQQKGDLVEFLKSL